MAFPALAPGSGKVRDPGNEVEFWGWNLVRITQYSDDTGNEQLLARQHTNKSTRW